LRIIENSELRAAWNTKVSLLSEVAWCRRGLASSLGGPPRRAGPQFLIRATVELSGKTLKWVGKPSLHAYNGEEADEALGRCRKAPPSAEQRK